MIPAHLGTTIARGIDSEDLYRARSRPARKHVWQQHAGAFDSRARRGSVVHVRHVREARRGEARRVGSSERLQIEESNIGGPALIPLSQLSREGASRPG